MKQLSQFTVLPSKTTWKSNQTGKGTVIFVNLFILCGNNDMMAGVNFIKLIYIY